MSEALSIISVSIAALGAIAMVTTASLSGWRGWLDLQRTALAGEQHRDLAVAAAPSPTGARIELADLKERVRKLEAIAAGIDL